MLQNAGYDSSQILGVIGKTEGMEYYCSNFLPPSVSEFSENVLRHALTLLAYHAAS